MELFPTQMSIISLFALPSGVEMIAYSRQEGRLCVSLLSTQLSSCCPLCGSPATRIHSRDPRRLADLPSAGQPVRFLLSVRKFFCDVPTCPRKIFTERLAPFVAPSARVTHRLFQIVQVIGLATGGRLGVRVTDRLGIQTTRQTILRRIMALPTAPIGQVVELGIDDFSFRRGRKFGTILVNLQTRQVIDVLADRKADTSATWMASHPEIRLVSRDRGGDYASAAATGAPQAVQCADRFHLLKNLGEALEGLLAHHLAKERTRQVQAHMAEKSHIPIWQPKRAPRYGPKLQQLQQARREERLARYQQVIALYQQGVSQQAIADRMGVGHSTISRWLAAGTFPEKKPREQASQIDRYLPYLFERWEAGCHNMASLFRELVKQGYQGSYESMRQMLLRFFPTERKPRVESPLKGGVPVLPREATFLFLCQPEDLKVEEKETLTMLPRLHPEVDLAYNLVQQFALMLRTRTGEQLNTWLEKVRTSHIRGFQSFVLGVERDKTAVQAGLILQQSNGVVEGKVNKLKLIKRLGYGRAGFPLLRQRVLHAL